MASRSFAEVHRDVMQLKDVLMSAAADLSELLPPKKARSAQHYIYQAAVMCLAHGSLLRQEMEVSGIEPLIPDQDANGAPF